MNTRKQKVDRWPQFLKYSVVIKNTDSLVAGLWKDDARLIDEAQSWLEENIGSTKDSAWHKDKWHPAKPKFLVTSKTFSESNLRWYLLISFYDEEDAMAFKLTFL